MTPSWDRTLPPASGTRAGAPHQPPVPARSTGESPESGGPLRGTRVLGAEVLAWRTLGTAALRGDGAGRALGGVASRRGEGMGREGGRRRNWAARLGGSPNGSKGSAGRGLGQGQGLEGERGRDRERERKRGRVRRVPQLGHAPFLRPFFHCFFPLPPALCTSLFCHVNIISRGGGGGGGTSREPTLPAHVQPRWEPGLPRHGSCTSPAGPFPQLESGSHLCDCLLSVFPTLWGLELCLFYSPLDPAQLGTL